ncbi:MAG: PIN domain-containing protein [Chloroflexi bacterium]|nr:PIN domain-containing protein [Chloroflexota bacterium]
MSGYLLDTNVVSELANNDPNSRVAAFILEHPDQWISAVVLHELEFGLQRLPAGRRRERLFATHIQFLSAFADRIVSLDRSAAELAAMLRARARRQGRTIEVADGLIAGTAMANDMTVVTRNVSDFAGVGVEVINPWEYETT